jgi:hypothetical protein
VFNIFLFLLNVVLLRQIARENLVNVEITDTYNFNEFENDDGIGSLFTNIGYFVQELGVGKKYCIEVNYICTRNWRITC